MSWPNGTLSPEDAFTFFFNDEQEISLIEEEPTLNHGDGIANNPDVENSSCTKRRKLRSKVWEEFTKYKEEDGKEWAICKHCQKKLVGSSKSGTTHLKNHLERCQHKRNQDGAADKSSELTTPGVTKEKSVIDQEVDHLDVTRMIIKHWPLTSQSSILNVFKEEKVKLRRCFTKLPCRFNIKIEVFHEVYRLMILQFIDENWELKEKIIDFQCVKDDRGFFEALKGSLLEWGIDKNICTIVRGIGQDKEVVTEINNWLSKRGSLPFGGQLFPVDCIVDILKCYIWVGNMWRFDLATKMRQSLDYVCKTSLNKMKFQTAVDKAKSVGKKVTSSGLPLASILDKFELLEITMGYREAFGELEKIHPDFKSINLEEDECMGCSNSHVRVLESVK